MEGVKIIIILLGDLARFLWLTLRPQNALAAENLFLRKQLAMFQERKVKPRRADTPLRITLVLLSRLFNWRNALVVVQPQTLIRWHRQGFRLFWRWKSRRGRPPIPVELRQLIRDMAMNNPSWGEERIANELLLKLGIRVSPRTVRKYMPKGPPGRPRYDQRWSTFVRNHASAILACDFCVVVIATFRLIYAFIVIEHQTRRIVHCNVTEHPTAAWTLQQLRETIPSDHRYRFLIHDRDGIFSPQLDQSISNMGIHILRSPPRSPKTNSLCERVIGSLRRECLDYIIPVNESHLRCITQSWVSHYNEGRPHSNIGPGIPDPPSGLPATLQTHRHLIPNHLKVSFRPILGGLHHEYGLLPCAA